MCPLQIDKPVCDFPYMGDRKANRARNFPAISNAMAEQWGTLAPGQ